MLPLTALLVACVSAQSYRAEGSLERRCPRVLLLPPQALVLEITAAGLPLPRADWTRTAEQALIGAIQEHVSEQGGRLVRYRLEEGGVPYSPDHRSVIKLYQVVQDTILTYHYKLGKRQALTLETKGERLDWTLGESVQPLQEDYAADYALFLAYRQATSSGGRTLLTALGFLLYGAIAPTSQSVGVASLVDLHNGRIVWTNVLRSQAWEVGQPEGLRSRGRKLLSDLPL